MSVRYVSTGDYVAKGQMVGRVGDTGNSTAAHLHFEIRYNGEKKDPLNYVKNPN
jgi:murein DD-endopeptidase MepM/ murein hydrolase activator NlpD